MGEEISFNDRFTECMANGTGKHISVDTGFTEIGIILCTKHLCQCKSSVCREERGVKVIGIEGLMK